MKQNSRSRVQDQRTGGGSAEETGKAVIFRTASKRPRPAELRTRLCPDPSFLPLPLQASSRPPRFLLPLAWPLIWLHCDSDGGTTMGATGLGLDVFLLVLCLITLLRNAAAIRFVIDREECFSHNVDYQGDTVHVSFVVIKADTPWHYNEDGMDLVVKDPKGDQIHDSRDKISDKFEIIVQKRGVHRFCFTNKSPYHETVDFDVHVGHFSYFDQHAKDEHFGPLFEQIAKLDEALYNIQFEQHWLEAQTDRQAILNENMSRRTVHKALFESAGLVAASVVQVYLMRRLFERKMGTSRV